jgi:hypothetical protein
LPVQNKAQGKRKLRDYGLVSATAFCSLARRAHKSSQGVFSVSLCDIDKALAPKKEVNVYMALLQFIHDFLPLFSTKESDKLPPLQGKGIDHAIELEIDK